MGLGTLTLPMVKLPEKAIFKVKFIFGNDLEVLFDDYFDLELMNTLYSHQPLLCPLLDNMSFGGFIGRFTLSNNCEGIEYFFQCLVHEKKTKHSKTIIFPVEIRLIESFEKFIHLQMVKKMA